MTEKTDEIQKALVVLKTPEDTSFDPVLYAKYISIIETVTSRTVDTLEKQNSDVASRDEGASVIKKFIFDIKRRLLMTHLLDHVTTSGNSEPSIKNSELAISEVPLSNELNHIFNVELGKILLMITLREGQGEPILEIFRSLKYQTRTDAHQSLDTKQAIKSHSNKLFPNSGSFDSSMFFLMPLFVSNELNRIIRSATKAEVVKQFNKSRKQTEFSANGTKLILSQETKIKVAEEFANILLRIRDAKVLQTFFALWRYCNDKDTNEFRDVPISKIMDIVLRRHSKSNYNSDQRRQFSSALTFLASLIIDVSERKKLEDLKQGKKKSVKTKQGLQVSRVRLFEMDIIEYSARSQYQYLSDNDIAEIDENEAYDKSIITRFSGRFLPGLPELFTGQPGSIYLNALLELDANKDRSAILLGYYLQTRFNQTFGESEQKPIAMGRMQIIQQCDFDKTNSKDRSTATLYIKKALEKLVKHQIIARYENLSNSDDEPILIYVPPLLKAELLKGVEVRSSRKKGSGKSKVAED